MRNVRLTSRERVNRFMRRQPHDSVPRHDSYWGETWERWRNEGMTVNPLEFLGNDFCGICWSDPRPYSSETTLAEDDETKTYRDVWGNTVRYWKHRSGTPEHVAFECVDRSVWERTTKPLLLERGPSVDVEAAKLSFARGRRSGLWTHLTGLESFEMTRRVVGDEITLMAMCDDPEWVLDVSQTMTTLVLKDLELLWGTGLHTDGLWIYGDMAYRNATMCSPDMYRDLIWPDHKRLADWAHSKGIPMIFHTDGDVNGVLDLYLEAGFDCLQPLESKANMDVRALAPQFGDRLSLFGNIDVMKMATNDREVLDEELRTKMCAAMANSGYAYHSDHSVPPSTSWDTYQFIVERLDVYGNYD